MSWRMNELRLLCLKHCGSTSRANSAGFQITKLQCKPSMGEVQFAMVCKCPKACSTAAYRPSPILCPGHNVVCLGVVHQVIAAAQHWMLSSKTPRVLVSTGSCVLYSCSSAMFAWTLTFCAGKGAPMQERRCWDCQDLVQVLAVCASWSCYLELVVHQTVGNLFSIMVPPMELSEPGAVSLLCTHDRL